MSTQPKFTPGPWKWDESWGAIVIDRPDMQKLICPMWTGCDRRGIGRDVVAEDTANANLIAAAPDLYAKLDAVLNDLREARDTGACSRSRDSQIADIAAALAKARGEVDKPQ